MKRHIRRSTYQIIFCSFITAKPCDTTPLVRIFNFPLSQNRKAVCMCQGRPNSPAFSAKSPLQASSLFSTAHSIWPTYKHKLVPRHGNEVVQVASTEDFFNFLAVIEKIYVLSKNRVNSLWRAPGRRPPGNRLIREMDHHAKPILMTFPKIGKNMTFFILNPKMMKIFGMASLQCCVKEKKTNVFFFE